MPGIRKRVNRRDTEENSKLPEKSHCRKCMKDLPSGHFFATTDPYLDGNNLMSICKSCISDMYGRIFETEHTIERAMLRICRMLNMKYSEAAIQATLAHINTQGKLPNDPSVPGIYKSKLISTQKTEIGKKETSDNFTFVEPVRGSVSTEMLDDSDDNVRDLKQFWGPSYTAEDYQFLEAKLAEWEDNYSHATKAEVFILKELCHRELELRNARIEQKSVDPILKSMQSLLNDGGLKPIQTKAGDSGKGHDNWGSLIRMIEETTPAEYYKDKQLFKDFDHIEKKYIIPYIVRSLKNFVLGSRDFNIVEDENIDEDEYMNLTEADNNGNESTPVQQQ